MGARYKRPRRRQVDWGQRLVLAEMNARTTAGDDEPAQAEVTERSLRRYKAAARKAGLPPAEVEARVLALRLALAIARAEHPGRPWWRGLD